MNKDNSDQKIIELTQRLIELRIQRETISREESIIHSKLVSYKKSTKSTSIPKSSPVKVYRDQQGIAIDIGDTVKFLTPTKFKGSVGTVDSFSPHRVIALNEDRRKVSKAGHNLSIVKKRNQDSSASPHVKHENSCSKS